MWTEVWTGIVGAGMGVPSPHRNGHVAVSYRGGVSARRGEQKRLGSASVREMAERLATSLSHGEVKTVAAAALLSLGGPERARLVSSLEASTADTVSSILRGRARRKRPKGARAPAAHPKPSRERVAQEWRKAWSEWGGLASETQDEHGDYILQEHHWEEPELDTGSLASDLEPIGARMRKLIPRVLKDSIDPDFSFLAAVVETTGELGSGLPDWMLRFRDDNDFGLGPEVTSGLLEWEFAIARIEGKDPFEVVDEICKAESTTHGLGLDHDTIRDFVLRLPDKDRKRIVEGIQAHRTEDHWRKALRNDWGGWQKVLGAWRSR